MILGYYYKCSRASCDTCGCVIRVTYSKKNKRVFLEREWRKMGKCAKKGTRPCSQHVLVLAKKCILMFMFIYLG